MSMKRSRLKNIISKSKVISNKQKVGNPFDEFKKSLPIEVDDNYRLEAAWKAYGSPKDYKSAIWEGLILPIDENIYKLPSIGYNEETDEYEYLNKGRENEIVNKDIRVWDNDVIPLVKELKLGGYVRTFNEEKDCWTYTKNSQERIESIENNELQINSFLKGGKQKIPFFEWVKTVNPYYSRDPDYDLEKAYNELPIEELEAWRLNGLKPLNERDLSIHLSSKYKTPNHPTYDENQNPEYKGKYGWFGSDETGWEFRPSPRLISIRTTLEKGGIDWYKEYWDEHEPNSTLSIGLYGESPIFVYNRVPEYIRRLKYMDRMKSYKPKSEPVSSLYVAPSFKQGGQMTTIPSGSLHARKNNMELAKEGEVTHKGIPVVDNEGLLQAEIERNEIIFSKDVTDKIEDLYKKYNEEESLSKKDDIAIRMGKIITCEITKNTQDNTGLIEEVKLSI